MSDRDTDLSAALDRATDRIGPADSAQHDAIAALARARVLRNRRRAGVAGAVAAVTVLAVVLAVTGRGLHRADAPVAPSSGIVPPTRAGVVQDVWDPRTAGDLPRGSTALPADLTPPAHPGTFPLAGPARAVLDHGDRPILDLLGTDGSWARAQLPSGTVNSAALSRDGTMLAVLGDGAVWVTDVREGTWRQAELPADGPASMWTSIGVRASWIGDTQVVLDGGTGVAILSADGSARPTSSYYGVQMASGLAVTPDETSVLFGMGRHSKVIREIHGGRPVRTFDASAVERFSLPVATRDRVVGTVSGIPGDDRPTDRAGVQVLDRTASYATTAYLPIARTRYRPGVGIASLGVDGIRPLAWLDEHTVLLQTGADRFPADWRLVAWNVDSGHLSVVSGGSKRVHVAAVAADLVAPGS